MATATTSPLQRRSGVYVLELKDPGYFYVGSSADLDARVEQHHMVGGTRSVKFVTDHGGVANVIPPLTPPEASLVSWEMKETIARMIRHGFNHVRGWEYAFPNALKEEDVQGLRKLIMGTFGPLCHNCGLPGHFAVECAMEQKAAWLVNLESCRPIVPKTGDDVVLELILEGTPQGGIKRKNTAATADTTSIAIQCNRCYRTGHNETECYARTAAGGRMLPTQTAVTTSFPELEESR